MPEPANYPVGVAGVAVWQDCCFAWSMSDLAYDISYLLECEPVRTEPREVRVAAAPPVAPGPSSLAATQEALARELLQADAAHEAMIQQYLRMAGQVTSAP